TAAQARDMLSAVAAGGSASIIDLGTDAALAAGQTRALTKPIEKITPNDQSNPGTKGVELPPYPPRPRPGTAVVLVGAGGVLVIVGCLAAWLLRRSRGHDAVAVPPSARPPVRPPTVEQTTAPPPTTVTTSTPTSTPTTTATPPTPRSGVSDA